MSEKMITFQNITGKRSDIEAFLVVTLMDDDGNMIKECIPFYEGEDLERVMKCLFNKKYKELANSIEYLQHTRIVDHMFDGILVKGKSDEGSFSLDLEQGFIRNVVKVNEKVLLDKSQEKLSKIRDFVIKNT